MDFVFDAYCGLYCGGCGLFQATQQGRNKEIAEKAGKPLEDVTCTGCKTDVVAGWCSQCPIRACAREKGLDYCLDCGDFPCQDWIAFRDAPDWPYHKQAEANMRAIKADGLAVWIKQQDAYWRCPSCNEQVAWLDRTCEECGSEVNAYLKSD
jgi:hypothetical protein